MLMTILPIPNGYRVVVSSAYLANRYRWQLLRDDRIIVERNGEDCFDTATVFELTGPIIPGCYRVEVSVQQ